MDRGFFLWFLGWEGYGGIEGYYLSGYVVWRGEVFFFWILVEFFGFMFKEGLFL